MQVMDKQSFYRVFAFLIFIEDFEVTGNGNSQMTML